MPPRVFASTVLTFAILSNAAPLFAQRQVSEIAVTPLNGIAPLRVEVAGSATDCLFQVFADMGGQVVYDVSIPYDPNAGCRGWWDFEFDHEFSCPGTYVIKVGESLAPGVYRSATVTVVAPSIPQLTAEAGASAYEAYVTTTPDIAIRPIETSNIDWGDGTSTWFSWEDQGSAIASPTHVYQVDGEYTATVTVYYTGRYCSYTQTSTTTVTVPNPGNPTRSTTWGGVKAMYR